MKPSDFAKVHPWSSVKGTSEHETVCKSIMIILSRTGDKWRRLSQKEYEKDGNWSDREYGFFQEVVGFTKSEDTAVLFSPKWAELQ